MDAGPLTDIRWMPFKNASTSLTIPGFAALQVTGAQIVGTANGFKKLVLLCDQIGSTANPNFNRNIVFNGPAAVGPSSGSQASYGRCARGGDDCQVLWDSGTPAAGETWGIKKGQYALSKGGLGDFVVDGIIDSGTRRMYGRWGGINTILGKVPSGTLAMNSSGTINLWAGAAGSETVTSGPWTATVYNRGAAIGTNALVVAQLIDGSWYVSDDGTATVLEGTLGSTLSSGTATASVGSLTAITPGALPLASTITANNDFGLAAASGAKCLVVGDGSTWVLQQVAHIVVTPLTDLQAADPTIQVKTRDIVVMPNADESDWTDKIMGADCPGG